MGDKQKLTLDKELDLEQQGLPTIKYRISSHWDRPIRLRLAERLPDSLETSELQFSPEEDDEWRVSDGEVVFERRLDSQGGLSTLFSTNTEEGGPLDAQSGSRVRICFWSIWTQYPTVEIASAEADDAEDDWITVPQKHIRVRRLQTNDQTSPVKKIVSDGGKHDRPTTVRGESSDDESDTGSASREETESAITRSNDRKTADAGSVSSVDEAGPAENGVARSGTGEPAETTVDDFLTALEEATISEEQRRTLREAIGVESTASAEARIERCEVRLSELSAYVDALEEFLDEEGTARQLLEDLRNDFDDVQEQLTALESELSRTATERDELDERLTEVEESLSSIQTVQSDVESLETRVDETTSSIEEDIDTLQATVEDFEDWQEKVSGAFAGVAGDRDQ